MTTTTTRTHTPTDAVARRARLATVGGALWALSSGAWAAADLEHQPAGTLSFVAVALSWWIFMVLPPALLVAGHSALRSALGPAAGRAGTLGIVTAATGLGAMGLGIGIEVASMTFGGDEVPAGHAILLIGFLISLLGALMTGITVLRRRHDGLSRAAGRLLVLALPLGLGVGLVGDLLLGENDAVFWAALTLPTGIAWLLLGRSLSIRPGA